MRLYRYNDARAPQAAAMPALFTSTHAAMPDIENEQVFLVYL